MFDVFEISCITRCLRKISIEMRKQPFDQFTLFIYHFYPDGLSTCIIGIVLRLTCLKCFGWFIGNNSAWVKNANREKPYRLKACSAHTFGSFGSKSFRIEFFSVIQLLVCWCQSNRQRRRAVHMFWVFRKDLRSTFESN